MLEQTILLIFGVPQFYGFYIFVKAAAQYDTGFLSYFKMISPNMHELMRSALYFSGPIGFLFFPILIVLGGVCALIRRVWWLALAGTLPWLVASIGFLSYSKLRMSENVPMGALGILITLSVVTLLALSRKEFR